MVTPQGFTLHPWGNPHALETVAEGGTWERAGAPETYVLTVRNLANGDLRGTLTLTVSASGTALEGTFAPAPAGLLQRVCGVQRGLPLMDGCGFAGAYNLVPPGGSQAVPALFSQREDRVTGAWLAAGEVSTVDGVVRVGRASLRLQQNGTVAGHISAALAPDGNTWVGNLTDGTNSNGTCAARDGVPMPNPCIGGGGLVDGLWYTTLGTLTVSHERGASTAGALYNAGVGGEPLLTIPITLDNFDLTLLLPATTEVARLQEGAGTFRSPRGNLFSYGAREPAFPAGEAFSGVWNVRWDGTDTTFSLLQTGNLVRGTAFGGAATVVASAGSVVMQGMVTGAPGAAGPQRIALQLQDLFNSAAGNVNGSAPLCAARAGEALPQPCLGALGPLSGRYVGGALSVQVVQDLGGTMLAAGRYNHATLTQEELVGDIPVQSANGALGFTLAGVTWWLQSDGTLRTSEDASNCLALRGLPMPDGCHFAGEWRLGDGAVLALEQDGDRVVQRNALPGAPVFEGVDQGNGRVVGTDAAGGPPWLLQRNGDLLTITRNNLVGCASRGSATCFTP